MKVILGNAYQPFLDGSSVSITDSASDPVPTCSLSLRDNNSTISPQFMQELIILDDKQIPNPTINMVLNPTMNPYTTYWGLFTYTGVSYSQNTGGGIIATFSNSTVPLNISKEILYAQWFQIVAGRQYCISATTSGSSPVGIAVGLQVDWYDQGLNFIVSSISSQLSATGTHRYSMTVTAPANAALCSAAIVFFITNATNSGSVTYTNIQFEPVWFPTVSYPTPFCGPSQTNCRQLPLGFWIRQYRKFAGFVLAAKNRDYHGNARTVDITAYGYAWLASVILCNNSYSSQFDSAILSNLFSTYLTSPPYPNATPVAMVDMTNVIQGVQLSSFASNWDDIRTLDNNLAAQTSFYWTIGFYWDCYYAPLGYNTMPISLICDNSAIPDMITTFPAYNFESAWDYTQPGATVFVFGSTGNAAKILDPVMLNTIAVNSGYQLPTGNSFARKVNESGLQSVSDCTQRGMAEMLQYDGPRYLYSLTTNVELIAGQAIAVTSNTENLSNSVLLIQQVTATWTGTEETLTDYWEYKANLGAINRQVSHILSRLFRIANANTSAPSINTTTLAIFERVGIADTSSTTQGPLWYSTGYSYKKAITIDHTKVSGGSNLSNFPVLISFTDSDLKTITNGGNVQNSNGYDIIFVDSTETTKLDHEIEAYTASSGAIVMWVRIPTLSASSNTTIFLYFGNTSISSSQENKIGVWDGNYKGVWHFNDNAATTIVVDSTSNNNNGTAAANTSTKSTAGEIANGLLFNGSSDYVKITNNSGVNIQTGDFTISLWYNVTTPTSYFASFDKAPSGGGNNRDYSFFINGANDGYWAVGNENGAIWNSSGASFLAAGWHYLIVKRSGNTLTLRMDGVTQTTRTNALTGSSGGDLYWGYNISGGGSSLNGKLDECRISNEYRTDGWDTTEFNNQGSPSIFYNTGPLIAQTASAYRILIENDNTIAYYRLDELLGTIADDLSGNAYTGTLHGTVTLGVTSLLLTDSDQAMTFDGSTGYISLPASLIPTGAHAWSIECWCNIASFPATYAAMVAFGKNVAQQSGQIKVHNSGANSQFVLSTFSGDIQSGNISTATTYHVVGTYDGTSIRLYVNGSLVAGPTNFTLNVGTDYASIGADGATASEFFNGTIDEPAIYSYALDSYKIPTHYARGSSLYAYTVLLDSPISFYRLTEPSGTTAYDISRNNYAGTITGSGVTYGVTGPHPSGLSKAMTFNGSTGEITATVTTMPTGSGAWSIEAWVNLVSFNNTRINVIASIGTWAVSQEIGLIAVDASQKLQIATFGNNYSSTTTLPTGSWHHVVGTYDGSSMRLYYDGNLILGPQAQAMNLTGTAMAIASTTGAIHDQINATICDVAIYNYSLSATQISNHYTVGTT